MSQLLNFRIQQRRQDEWMRVRSWSPVIDFHQTFGYQISDLRIQNASAEGVSLKIVAFNGFSDFEKQGAHELTIRNNIPRVVSKMTIEPDQHIGFPINKYPDGGPWVGKRYVDLGPGYSLYREQKSLPWLVTAVSVSGMKECWFFFGPTTRSETFPLLKWYLCCGQCEGTGLTGLWGPRGLGIISKGCQSCNGKGRLQQIRYYSESGAASQSQDEAANEQRWHGEIACMVSADREACRRLWDQKHEQTRRLGQGREQISQLADLLQDS